ncbi:hypothetical protein [Synechococcus sp. CBW1107]|nr:hypothetical protein [Synechococcus sp. CBW1107]CAK6696276.1 hypothetical protein MNNICLKF_02010 [Synechococcus sp. CBW1107]
MEASSAHQPTPRAISRASYAPRETRLDLMTGNFRHDRSYSFTTTKDRP